MKRVNKILSLAAFAFILNFVCITSIFAKSVAINGGIDDIYATGGSGSAVFDKNTNTLTLNGYDNDSIIFEEFDGETINVVLKDNNKIKSLALGGGYSAFGVDEDSAVTFNINAEANSSLLFKNYEYGILIPNGTLNINGGKYTFEDITDKGISLSEETDGDISIKNADIEADGLKEVVSNAHGSVITENTKYLIKNISNSAFFNNEGMLVIKKSNIDVSDSKYFSDFSNEVSISDSIIKLTNIKDGIYSFGNLEITNSDITVDGIDRVVSAAGDVVINNSNFNLNSYSIGFSGDNLTFNNCNITARQNEVEFSPNLTNIQKSSAFLAMEMVFKNSNLDIIGNYVNMITFSGTIEFDNTNASLVTKYITPILAIGEEEVENSFEDMIIIKNSNLVEKKPIPSNVKTDTSLIENIYIYMDSEPIGEYKGLALLTLFETASKELHFTANNTLSFDANGGTGTMESIMVSGKIDIPKNEFTAPNGKKFKGWALTKDGEVITELNVTSNVKLYAIWENESIIEDIKEKIEEKIEDIVPDTGDKVILYIALGGLSILAITGIALHLSKKKYN